MGADPGAAWRGLRNASARRRARRKLAGRGPVEEALAAALEARSDAGGAPWSARIEARRHELASREDSIPRWGRPWLPNREALVPEGDARTTEPIPVARAVEASKDPGWCRVLFELTRRLRPRYVVEMGTNLGISGCYLAAALEEAGEGGLITLEGSPHKAAIARSSFEAVGLLQRVDIVVGDFADTVDSVLARLGANIDLAFIDGFHQREATLTYHDGFVRAAGQAVLVYDDIRWSSGMKEAWDRLRLDDRVATSVDAQTMGFVRVPRGSRIPLHVDWPLRSGRRS